MKLFNTLFYVLLFVGFFLPTNSSFYLPLPGILLSIREIAFLLLPVINPFCISRERAFISSKKLKKLILTFLLIVLFTEFLKIIAYNESLGGVFKDIRIGLPLFSSLLLVWQGVRVNIRKAWKVLLWAISTSVIISLLSIFIPLPIYYDLEQGENILEENSGRLSNANAAFGIIGMYLLFKDKDKWFNRGKLPFYASILSIISLILGFNRTYLALLFVLFICLAFTTFKWKKAFKLILIPLLILGAFGIAYKYSVPIQRQIDRRILSILEGSTTIEQSSIENNRDQIYEGMVERIEEGYWIIGLPYGKEIFTKFVPSKGDVSMGVTDTSLVNILLINGIIAFFLFILILVKVIRIRYLPRILIFVFILASLNIDALYSHNSILFLLMFGVLYSGGTHTVKRKIHNII